MTEYESLERLMVPAFRDQILADLAMLRVPLEYADGLAESVLDARGTSIYDRTISLRETMWDVDLEFPGLAEAYYSARIPAREFQQFLTPAELVEVRKAKLNPTTVNRLMGQGASTPVDTLYYVLRIPASFSEVAMNLVLSPVMMKELYDHGVRRVSKWTDRGQVFFRVFHECVMAGYQPKAVLACLDKFGTLQCREVLDMGTTAKQARRAVYSPKPWSTTEDLIRSLHPDMPEDYVKALA